MCGIAGFTRIHPLRANGELVHQMSDLIKHRGPDGHGVLITESIALAHRRLSIIDLSEAGTQPMTSSDGRFTLVFNGEIYNFLELRNELEAQGEIFSSHSDTEVLLRLYSKEGKYCLSKLNGMFAFAVWDHVEKRLFLARDRLGKKPLYYGISGEDIFFASELTSVLATHRFELRIRPDALYDYVAYQYVPDPKSIIAGIFKLPPGHYLEFSRNGMQITQWWDLSLVAKPELTRDAYIAEVLSLVRDATKLRMVADVPIGAFLSGGIDSGGVVATMASLSKMPISTCTIAFNDKELNEAEIARRVAQHFGTDHHETMVHESIEERLHAILACLDEPLADPSLIPTFYVSSTARNKVTVALSGDGGDELFAGYEKYAADARETFWRSVVPSVIRERIAPVVASHMRASRLTLLRRVSSFLSSLAQDPAMAYYQTNSQLPDAEWELLANQSTKSALGNYHPSSLTTSLYNLAPSKDHLARILYVDMKSWLPGDILAKVDRASMANGLEVRCPLLDYRLVELAFRVPSQLKLSRGKKKILLKEAFRNIIPEFITRQKKMGFVPPLSDWLRNELHDLAHHYLITNPRLLQQHFDAGRISQIWKEHNSGQRDHVYLLWSLLVLELWWCKTEARMRINLE